MRMTLEDLYYGNITRKDGEPIEHGPALDYIYPPPPPVPDWVREAEEAEQKEIW